MLKSNISNFLNLTFSNAFTSDISPTLRFNSFNSLNLKFVKSSINSLSNLFLDISKIDISISFIFKLYFSLNLLNF